PVYELLGGRVHERLRSYTYLYPKEGDPPGDVVYRDPDLAAERAAEYVALGFTAVKFDPAGPYTTFDPRQPDLEALERSEAFARVLETGAASILQPALGRVGGLLEAKKIAGIAEAHYAQIAPHLYCGPVEGAANVQLAACSPNFLVLESIQTWGGFHAEILKTPIRWEDGYVIPPDAPGLGVELDEEVAAAHPYEGDELHLEPA